MKDNVFNKIIAPVKEKLMGSSSRTQGAVKNIAVSFVTKVLSILCSLAIVPLTINYVNPTKYGIWLALSSVVGWFTFFNLGLTNGFRNKFAEAIAKGDKVLARQYVSTTYLSLGTLAAVIFIIGIVCNSFVDWSNVLKVDSIYHEELQKVFAILITVFCVAMVVKVFTLLLTADQKPGLASIVDLAGQIVSLTAIWVLTKVSSGSLFNLALFYAGAPSLVILITSIFAFCFSRYQEYAPSISTINVKLIKNIIGLGWQFFVINICLLVIFQLTNVILSREVGPESVTQYNIAYKYFNILYMVAVIVLTPFWSAFTDAYHKDDFAWMKKSMATLERLCLVALGGGIIMLLGSGLFYKIWVGTSVDVPFALSAVVLVYVLISIWSSVYMYMINGIGTIRIQLILYSIMMALSLPILIFSCRYLGVYGAIISPSIVYLLQAVVGKIQLTKILNKTAGGLWLK